MIYLYTEGSKKNQVSKMVIPFAYRIPCDISFNQYVTNLCDSENKKWLPVSIKEANNELYEHILSLMGDDITQKKDDCSAEQHNYIGQAVTLNTTHSAFPNFQLTCKGIPEKVTFGIKGINLILFKTEMGFLTYDMDYSEFDNVDQIIVANNAVKSIKHCDLYKVVTNTIFIEANDIQFLEEDNLSCYHIVDDTDHKKIKYVSRNSILVKDSSIKELRLIYKNKVKVLKVTYNIASEEAIEYKQLLYNILEGINIPTYFNQSFSKSLQQMMSNKANVFSAITIKYDNQDLRDIHKDFYRLRKGYSNSYIPDELEYSVDNIEIYKPFIDSYWGVSREGCANLTYDSNSFMRLNYSNRIDTYFYLYIIALHQYYGLLYLAKEISYLPSTIKECAKNEVFEKLKFIRTKCNFFYMNSVFEEVSHISHQASYYSRLTHVLGIKNMQKELNYEIDRISAIVEQVKDDEEERNRDKKKRWISLISVLVSLFSISSILDSTLSFWKNTADINVSYHGYEFINSAILLGIVFIICTLFVLGFFLYNRKSNKEICNDYQNDHSKDK